MKLMNVIYRRNILLKGALLAMIASSPLLLAHCTPKNGAQGNDTKIVSGSGTMPKGLVPMKMSLEGAELEDAVDSLSADIAAMTRKHDFTSTAWTVNAARMFPQLSLVWRMHAKEATPAEISADPEMVLVYKYLLGSEERVQNTLYNLSTFMCWGRLDRVWFTIFDNPSNANMVNWGKCPLASLPYVADANQVSCPQHGISFTFPNHEARPSIDEMFRQLVMGEFCAKYRHGLDEVFFGLPESSIKEGETVADIGCGVGSFTMSMCEAVGDKGQVLATDINSHVLDFMDFVIKENQLSNVTTVRATPMDPGLHFQSLDRAFMIYVYNGLAGMDLLNGDKVNQRTERYLHKVVEAMKPGGRLVVVEMQPSPSNSNSIFAPTASQNLQSFGLREVGLKEITIATGPIYVLTMEKPVAP